MHRETHANALGATHDLICAAVELRWPVFFAWIASQRRLFTAYIFTEEIVQRSGLILYGHAQGTERASYSSDRETNRTTSPEKRAWPTAVSRCVGTTTDVADKGIGVTS